MQATQSLGEDLVEDDCKRLCFYFSVYIWGISPSRRTLRPYAKGEDPQMFPHSHKKDSCLQAARFLYSPWILLRFGKHPRALTPSDGTTSGEPTRTRTWTHEYSRKLHNNMISLMTKIAATKFLIWFAANLWLIWNGTHKRFVLNSKALSLLLEGGAYKEAIIISYHIILYYSKFIDKLVAFDH